jgi:hypothetical protein
MSIKSELSKLGVPKCNNVKSKGPLPNLVGPDGLTDFPVSGSDLEISFDNSNFALFPFEIAANLASAKPKAWCSGGNHFGNYAFEYWYRTEKAMRDGRPIPKDCLRWIKKREGYIARHRKDFRLAGVVAMIKWAGFVDWKGNGSEDGSSLNYMVDLVVGS